MSRRRGWAQSPASSGALPAGVTTTLFSLLPSTLGPGTLPAGFLGGWGSTAPGGTYNGSGAGYASVTSGTSQVASATVAVGANSNAGLMQFISQPLQAVQITGYTYLWMAGKNSNLSNMYGSLFVGILTPAGALRSTLFVVADLTLNSSQPAGQETVLGSTAWNGPMTAQTPVAGDRLVIEVGLYCVTAGNLTAYAGGSTVAAFGNIVANAYAGISFSNPIFMQ